MVDLLSELPVPLEDQIRCVERELMMREQVYSRRVQARTMLQKTADLEMAQMKAVLATLQGLRHG